MYPFTSFIAVLATAAAAQTNDLTQYVLPSTGEANGGNTFPGAALPFGMVKLGPDSFTGFDNYAGDGPGGKVTGFSMMHESGTGGAPKYGVVSQMPVLGPIANPLENIINTRAAPDDATIGYYRVVLGTNLTNITVELSATSRAGIYSYSFPSGQQASIVVDISHLLPSFRGQGLSQHYLGGNISTSSNHYEGYGDYNNGWNRAPDWRIYFCAYFETPASVQTFVGTDNTSNILATYSPAASVTSTARLGAVFNFGSAANVTSRVGISYISAAQACSNVNTQIPAGTALTTVRDNAKQVWNSEVLSKVTTTETNVGNLQLLYSSMYSMHLLPSNRTGENPRWKSSEPYFDDTFTTWDLFRCTFSLFHVFQPTMFEEYIRSLIDIFRFDGYMPDARSSNFNGATQGGSNSDNVLADAWVKGVRGAVNWTAGYEAMVKDAEITPPNNNDPRDMSSSTKEGRGALPDWLELGYITPKYGRSVTRAVEYSFNDFSLYQVATGLGKSEDANKYLKRSRNWRNHWNPNAESLNFTGFVVPRSTAGFLEQDPLNCGGCYWGDAYYEGLPWEYSFNAHHDINTLIALSGGPETFSDRLSTMFKPGINTFDRSGAFNNTLFNPGNEVSFSTPYLFNYVSRQDLSVLNSRYIAKTYYSPTPSGLPGNSDAGAMESWLLWNMLGLYPMVGQTTFLIGSPWFANTTISLGGGKSLTMTTTGVANPDLDFYVQSLKVNGKPWNKSWLTWDDVFADGGSMDFVLGPNPTNWTTGPPPPSPASEFAATTNPTAIAPPGKVPMSPSLEALKAAATREARKKRLMRNVGLGLMGFAVLCLATGCAAAWCLWKRRKAAVQSAAASVDQEKGLETERPARAEEKGWVAKAKHIALSRTPWKAHRKHGSTSPVPRSGAESIGGDTVAGTESRPESRDEKKELKIKLMELPPNDAVEPWTPRGTNRRTDDKRIDRV